MPYCEQLCAWVGKQCSSSTGEVLQAQNLALACPIMGDDGDVPMCTSDMLTSV